MVKVGVMPLPDGRRIHVEVDHNGMVLATLVYEKRPDNIDEKVWTTLESRNVPLAFWEQRNKPIRRKDEPTVSYRSAK